MKNTYDLIITAHGPAPMRPGYIEHTAELAMCHLDPADIIIHESPRAIYRIDRRDAEKPSIKRFLARADQLTPLEDTARRHYYVKRGNWSNVYSLRWTDSPDGDAAAQVLGYERITRAEALQLARAEIDRRLHDPGFSGHADARVYPLDTITRGDALDDISTATAAPGYNLIAERA